MENKGSKFFKKGSAFLIAPALFSNFLPGVNTSAAGETVFSKAASESSLLKPDAGVLSFFKNHWGASLVVLAGFVLFAAWWLWPSKSETTAEGSGAETGNTINGKKILEKSVESSSEDEDEDKDDDKDDNIDDKGDSNKKNDNNDKGNQKNKGTLEDVLSTSFDTKLKEWITYSYENGQKNFYDFSSKKGGFAEERFGMFRLEVEKLNGKATFYSVGGRNRDGKIFEISNLNKEEGIKKLKELSNKVHRFLTMFDKVFDLCAEQEIEPEEKYDGPAVRSFKFNLRPAELKKLSLELGVKPDKTKGLSLKEIEINNEGRVKLYYADKENLRDEEIVWCCFHDKHPEDLDNFEEAFSEKNEEFKGWVSTEIKIKIKENKIKSSFDGYSSDSDGDD